MSKRPAGASRLYNLAISQVLDEANAIVEHKTVLHLTSNDAHQCMSRMLQWLEATSAGASLAATCVVDRNHEGVFFRMVDQLNDALYFGVLFTASLAEAEPSCRHSRWRGTPHGARLCRDCGAILQQRPPAPTLKKG
jgi:hypothetical protein